MRERLRIPAVQLRRGDVFPMSRVKIIDIPHVWDDGRLVSFTCSDGCTRDYRCECVVVVERD